ncbi:hypothetical protein NEA10_07080 [Phormidium yuhuli AB48]|uniref:Uncharacterized protein n=1 Tax=Phormidium yuhuli AB48 TaxID=2940671 RepID=A0ABY5ATF9_9CYAN|nr:hypothetical protein [Phormidium yuhuli]USR92473.1 hypothetical protein NEA10_07080 [Phormidium yuhuli AB48]
MNSLPSFNPCSPDRPLRPKASFDLRTQLQSLLWSVELLELRLDQDVMIQVNRDALLEEIQRVRTTIEETCNTCDRLSYTSETLIGAPSP